MDGSAFIDFERTPRYRLGELNLTPLIDILFILIIFFMLTASFMRIESMELVLPSAGSSAAGKDDTVHLFVYANGEMAIGQRRVGQDDLNTSLARVFAHDPNTKIMLLTAEGVTMQQLVSLMDKVYIAGGKSLFVRKWNASAAPPLPTSAPKRTEEPRKPNILDLWWE